VPLEGVVHALNNIHAALTPGGLLVDTQPLSPHPPVLADGAELGTLDMREWLDLIRAVDDLIAEVVDAGFYEMQHEARFVLTDAFDNGRECLETVSSWRETRVPSPLVSRLGATHAPVTVEQEVRLRLFRSAGQAR
jgi:hypothetical protein